MRTFLHVLLLAAAAAAQPYDVVIRNGHIIDGTGSPWYAADMGIREGRIASIGRLGGQPPSAPSMRTVWWWHRDSSTCWGNPS